MRFVARHEIPSTEYIWTEAACLPIHVLLPLLFGTYSTTIYAQINDSMLK